MMEKCKCGCNYPDHWSVGDFCICRRIGVDEWDASGCPEHNVSIEYTSPVPHVDPNEELDF